MDAPYAPDLSKPVVPPLMTSVLYHCMWSKDEKLGRHHRVLFKDIAVYLDDELSMPPSRFLGASEENMSYDMAIENLTVNGRRIQSLEEANVTVGPYARDITLQ